MRNTAWSAPRARIAASVPAGCRCSIGALGDLVAMGWDPYVLQIKEKFGGIRIYIGNGTRAIFDRIGEAEKESFRTCEECGAPGKTKSWRFWIKTLCPTHGAAEKARTA